jgi:hypothetical protein
MKQLTAPQARTLAVLRSEGRGLSARAVARALWPDSPAWNKRTRRGATHAGGALGATMPMKAGALLWRMRSLGLPVWFDYRTNLWHSR